MEEVLLSADLEVEDLKVDEDLEMEDLQWPQLWPHPLTLELLAEDQRPQPLTLELSTEVLVRSASGGTSRIRAALV